MVPALQFLIDGFHIDRAVSSDSGAAGARHLRGKDIDSVVRAQPAQVAGARVLLPEMTEVARIEDSRLPDTVRSVENRLTDNPRSVENTLVEEEKPIDFARGNLESIAEDESISFHKRDHGDDLKVTSESTPEEVCFSDRYFQVLNELQENIFAAAAQYDEIERMVHLQNAKSNFVEIWAAKRIQPQLPELPKSALPFPSPLSAEKKAALIEGRIKNAQNELDWWKAQRRTSTDYPWPEFPPADDQKQRFPPTAAPTSAPPTSTPTSDPTSHPTSAPSASPTATPAPTSVPTSVPTAVPTSAFLSSAIPVLLYSDEKTFNTPDIQNILNTNLWRNK